MNELLIKDIEDIAKQFEDGKLEELFNIKEVTQILIDEIHKETQLPKFLIKILLKILIFISKKGISKLSGRIQKYLFDILSTNPKILTLVGFINGELISKLENNEIIEYIEKDGKEPKSIENADSINKILYSIFTKEKVIIKEIKENIEKTNQVLTHLQMLNNPDLLIKSLKNTEGINKLRYINDSIPFFGRENEIKLLDGFCKDEKKLSWLIINANAGEGKSKLALEYCKRLPSYWDKGFLEIKSFENLNNWQPLLNTFIVIDNFKDKIEEIKEFMPIIHQRISDVGIKVRILLIERNINIDKIHEQLLSGDNNNLIDYQFKVPYKLSCLSDKSILQIIKEFDPLNKLNTPMLLSERKKYEKQLINDFKSFDNNKRALFAAIYGMILSNNLSTVSISTNNFLKDLLFDLKETIDEKHLNLISLCIIKGKISIDEIKTNLIPSEEEINEVELSKIIDIDQNISLYHKIEPDIIGEIFLLEYLKPNSYLIKRNGTKKFKEKKIKKFLDFCWEKYPFHMFDIVLLCFQDFPKHDSLKYLYNVSKFDSFDFNTYSYYSFFPYFLVSSLIKNGLINESKELEQYFHNRYMKEDDNLLNLTYSYIFGECVEIYKKEKSFDEIDKYFRKIINRCPELKKPIMATLINFYTDYIDFLTENNKFIEAMKYSEFYKIFNHEKIFSVMEYNQLINTFNKLFLNIENKNTTLKIKNIHFNILLDIGLKKDNLSYYKILIKLLNNYICNLITIEEEYEYSLELVKLSINLIEKIDQADVYEIGSSILIYEIIIAEKQSNLIEVKMTHLSCASRCIAYLRKSKSGVMIIHTFVNWFSYYISKFPHLLLHKNKLDFYKQIRTIPLSPEVLSLIEEEVRNLNDILEKETNNFENFNVMMDISSK